MKEIKFRQKLKAEYVKNNEQFHYWGYIDEGFTSPVGKNYSDTDSEQLTGLRDINGVDIYEGDIIRNSNGYAHMDKLTVATFKDGSFHAFGSVSYNDGTSTESELIGNIYENPELLESNPDYRGDE